MARGRPVEYSGYLRLAAAIIRQAVDDWHVPRLRPEVERFLRGRWFANLCDTLDLDPGWIASAIRSGRYGRLRAIALRAH